MEKINAIGVFSSLDGTQMSGRYSDYDFESAYRKLASEFPDYTLIDLFMVCKIDRLYRTRKISETLRDQLTELYDLRVSTNDEYLMISGDGSETEEVLYEKLESIDKVLGNFDLVPTDFTSFIDSTIKAKSYDNVDTNSIQKLLSKNDSK